MTQSIAVHQMQSQSCNTRTVPRHLAQTRDMALDLKALVRPWFLPRPFLGPESKFYFRLGRDIFQHPSKTAILLQQRIVVHDSFKVSWCSFCEFAGPSSGIQAKFFGGMKPSFFPRTLSKSVVRRSVYVYSSAESVLAPSALQHLLTKRESNRLGNVSVHFGTPHLLGLKSTMKRLKRLKRLKQRCLDGMFPPEPYPMAVIIAPVADPTSPGCSLTALKSALYSKENTM